MTENFYLKLARLNHEKALIEQDMARPGFQLIMRKLQELSDKMLLEYDGALTLEEVKRIQAYRDVIEIIIPKVLEEIVNVDVERGEERWKFKPWLKSVWNIVDEFICNGWLNKAKRLFAATALRGER